MTFAQTLLSPLQPVVAALLAPSSICSIYSLGLAILIAFAWLARRRKNRGRPVLLRTLARAVFSRRVLLHRSTLNALKALVGASAFSRTAAGSEPPSVGRAGLPAADSKV
jgi:hypothetical protein